MAQTMAMYLSLCATQWANETMGTRNVALALQLLLRDDDLARLVVVRLRDGRAENADAADDAADRPPLLGCAVRRIADHHLALRHLLAGLHAADLAVDSVHEAVNVLVEHVSAVVDGRQAREALRQAAQTVDRVAAPQKTAILPKKQKTNRPAESN